MSTIDDIVERASRQWKKQQVLEALGGEETIRRFFELYFEAVKDEVRGHGISDADVVDWMSRNRERIATEYVTEWEAVMKG